MFAKQIRKYRRWLRRQRHRDPNSIPTVMIVILALIVAFLGYQLLYMLPALEYPVFRQVLAWGMPRVAGEQAGYPGWEYTLRSVVYMVTDYDIGNPHTFLEGTLPTRQASQSTRAWEERSFVFLPDLPLPPEPVRPEPPETAERDPQPRRREPQVLIYHTHSSEMYLGPEAVRQGYMDSHHVFRSAADPTVTGVMEVGKHLTQALTSRGIPTLHNTTIHDFPSLAYSYMHSERTVRELLKQYQEVEIVIDLHRDANVPDPVFTYNDEQVARLLLVVGTAQDTPHDHPNWEQNLAFARRLQQTAERMYPGFVRPMQVRRDARYNQHLHPQSVILEVGSVDNTVQEALLAAELVANVLHAMLEN